MKRGNSREAKGPCQIHVFIRSEENRLDTRPTTEESDGLRWDQHLDQPEKKSGVTLPPDVSELRRKLGQKAKQELTPCACLGPREFWASRVREICMHGLKRAEAAGYPAPPLLDWLICR